ncbi:MAG: outer membrane beta-barrel protein [Tatlockia sp.]|nr:outer membrane beta-barrel protein [Tatlockia sp.]
MKKTLLLGLTGVASLISAASYAGTMGPIETFHRGGWIIGGDIGYGYLSTQEEDILAPVPLTFPALTEVQDQHHKIGDLVGGGYVGRDFEVSNSLLLGLELGYKYLGQSKYKGHTIDNLSFNFIRTDIQVYQHAVDALLTAKYYVWQGLNLYAKAGAAYVRSKTTQASNFNIGSIAGGLFTEDTIWRIKPEFDLGFGYTFGNNLGVNFTYTHIGGVDTNVTGLFRFYNNGPDRTPAVFQYNGLTAGLSYTFG